MAYLLLLGAVCCSGAMSITANIFNKKNLKGIDFSSLYSLIVTASSFLVWSFIYFLDFSFDARVLVYSSLFGIFYALAFIGLYYAMNTGSASLTSFVKQLSLIAVAVWGFFFWDNPLTQTVVIGLVLVLVSLFLCFKPSRDGKMSLKWCFYSFFLIIGNAGCSIVQKYQQISFNSSHSSLLMVGATFVAVLVCLFMYIKGERPKLSDMSHHTAFLPIVAGVSSAVINVLVLKLLSSEIPESVFFPIIGVGGIILTTLFSVGVYKERLSPLRWSGLAVGLVAIVLLNI